MQNASTPVESIRQMLRRVLRDGNMRQILSDWKWILSFTRRP